MITNHGHFPSQGVTQGYPLSMICYGIGILLLIRKLKSEFPASKNKGMQMMDQLPERLRTFRSATWSQLRIFPRIVEEHPSSCTPQCRTNYGWVFRPTLSSRNWFTLSRQLHRWRDSWIANKVDDWVYSMKKLADAALPTHRVHILLSSAHYN